MYTHKKKEFKELILIGSCVRKQVSNHSVKQFQKKRNIKKRLRVIANLKKLTRCHFTRLQMEL